VESTYCVESEHRTFFGRITDTLDLQRIRSGETALPSLTIRKIRTKAAISPSVFAAHLNVTTGSVSKWGRGEKQPSGPAAKLLSLAARYGIAAIA